MFAINQYLSVKGITAAECGKVIAVVKCYRVVAGIVSELDVLVHLFQFVELGAPCTVGTDNTIIYEVALVGCIGPVVACAVLVETILGEVACLDVVG